MAVSQYNIFPVDDFVLSGSKDGSVSGYGGPMPRAVLVFHFDEAAVFIFQVFFPFAIVTTVIPNVQPVVVLLVGAVLQCNFVSVGDQVIYSKYAGTEVEFDKDTYIIVKQSDILAIIK